MVENMALAATALGLGSVYLMSFLVSFSANKDLLNEVNLPECFAPISGIALDYPTEPLTKEKELKQTITINTIK